MQAGFRGFVARPRPRQPPVSTAPPRQIVAHTIPPASASHKMKINSNQGGQQPQLWNERFEIRDRIRQNANWVKKSGGADARDKPERKWQELYTCNQ